MQHGDSPSTLVPAAASLSKSTLVSTYEPNTFFVVIIALNNAVYECFVQLLTSLRTMFLLMSVVYYTDFIIKTYINKVDSDSIGSRMRTQQHQTCRHKFDRTKQSSIDFHQLSVAKSMSRICVKNIGKNTNEKQIRELFSSKGEVTDVKVITSKDGKSRRFAFVGFRTDVQASEAQKHFNNTFIGMSRIVVDMAKKFNDQSLKENKQKFAKKGKQHSAKANESDSEGDSDVESPQKAAKKPTKDESFTSIDPNSVAGRKKAEFLEMMKPRRNTNKWANDDVAGGVSLDPSRQPVPVSAQDSDSDSERMAVDAADSSSDDDSSVDNFADAEPGAGAGDSSKPISDLDYLRSKIRCKRADSAFSSSDSDSERSDDGSSSGSEGDGEGERSDPDDSAQPSHSNRNNTGKTNTGKNKDEKATAKHTKDTDNNSEQGDDAAVPENDETEIEDARLFVKNLPFSCTEEEFKSLFSAFGPISELHLPLDEEKRGKGYGFVQYMLPEHADAALDALASEAFQGRVLYIVKVKCILS